MGTFRRPLTLLSPLALVAALSLPIVPATAAPAAGRASARTWQADTWQPVGAPAVARSRSTATLLQDGQVLIAGGDTTVVELYDPTTESFSPTDSLPGSRQDATATLLQNGDVLLAGGLSSAHQSLASALLYDPTSGTWTPTGSMLVPRFGATATLLDDGDVLVAGGGCTLSRGRCGSFGALSSTERYDPGTGTWSGAGSMSTQRRNAAAVLLADGDVMVAGGFTFCDDTFCYDTKSVDIYDPATHTWRPAANLHVAREQETLTLLPDGTVLCTGGSRLNPDLGTNVPLHDTERFDPATGQWRDAAPVPSRHEGQSAVLLPNGWLLAAGGGSTGSQIYQPSANLWVSTGSIGPVRRDQTMTALPGGDVLLTGGGLDSAEVFQTGPTPLVLRAPSALAYPSTQVGATTKALRIKVTNVGDSDLHPSAVSVTGVDAADFSASSPCVGATLAPGGSCVVTVRFSPSAVGLRTASVQLVDDAPNSPQQTALSGYGNGPDVWSLAGDSGGPRLQPLAVSLPDGDVLIAGGYSFDGTQTSAVLYDPASRTFRATGSMMLGASEVQGTVLSTGDVLVAGGDTDDFATNQAQLYDPSTGTWSFTTPMLEAGESLDQTLLPDGTVLVTGFDGLNSEIFDPTTATWTRTGYMRFDADESTANLLPDGDVLVAGGFDDPSDAQLYDPAKDRWTTTGSLITGRQDADSVDLPDGDVLVVGGSTSAGGAISSAELYDPSAGTFTATKQPMHTGRIAFTLTLLPNGMVLAAGGCSSTCSTVNPTSDLYNPAKDTWMQGPDMVTGRNGAAAALLPDGEVLVAGGADADRTVYSSAETYTPALVDGTPDQGPAGTTVRLRGDGFFAFETVRLTFDGSPLGTARTRRTGGFGTTVTIPAAADGPHTITAVGGTSRGRASFTFTVTG